MKKDVTTNEKASINTPHLGTISDSDLKQESIKSRLVLQKADTVTLGDSQSFSGTNSVKHIS